MLWAAEHVPPPVQVSAPVTIKKGVEGRVPKVTCHADSRCFPNPFSLDSQHILFPTLERAVCDVRAPMMMTPQHTLLRSVGSVTIDSEPRGEVGTGSPRGMMITEHTQRNKKSTRAFPRKVLQLAWTPNLLLPFRLVYISRCRKCETV